jgi:hypothetical protein
VIKTLAGSPDADRARWTAGINRILPGGNAVEPDGATLLVRGNPTDFGLHLGGIS